MDIPPAHESFAAYAGQLLGIFQAVVRGYVERFEELLALYAKRAAEHEKEGRFDRQSGVLDRIAPLQARLELHREVARLLADRRRKLNLSQTSLAAMTVGRTAAVDAFARMVMPAEPTDEAMQASLCTQILGMVMDVDVMQREGSAMMDQMMGAAGDLAELGGIPPGMATVMRTMMIGGHLSTKTGEPTYPIVRAFLGQLFEDPPVPEGDEAAAETADEQAARHDLADRMARSRDEVFRAYTELPTTLDSVMEAYLARHPDADVEVADFTSSPCQENIIANLVMMTAVALSHVMAKYDPAGARAQRNVTRGVFNAVRSGSD